MARSRNLKPGFFKNEVLADCEPLARLLFSGLWTLADRDGRLEDRPRFIKAECLPYDDCDIEALLNQLADKGFIRRYSVGGTRVIDVPKFVQHQQPHHKELSRSLPPFEASLGQNQGQTWTSPGQDRNKTGTSPGTVPLIPSSLIPSSLIPSNGRPMAADRPFDIEEAKRVANQVWDLVPRDPNDDELVKQVGVAVAQGVVSESVVMEAAEETSKRLKKKTKSPVRSAMAYFTDSLKRKLEGSDATFSSLLSIEVPELTGGPNGRT